FAAPPRRLNTAATSSVALSMRFEATFSLQRHDAMSVRHNLLGIPPFVAALAALTLGAARRGSRLPPGPTCARSSRSSCDPASDRLSICLDGGAFQQIGSMLIGATCRDSTCESYARRDVRRICFKPRSQKIPWFGRVDHTQRVMSK